MEVKVFKSGLLQTNTYLVIKDNSCIIIDPAFSYDLVTKFIDKSKYNVLAILLTHGHFDHIVDAESLARLYNCKIYIGKEDLELIYDSSLNGSKRYLRKDITIFKSLVNSIDKEVILKFDNIFVDVMFTPGHTRGSCCFKIDNELFSGDTLFEDGIGRVDMYGGDKNAMEKSLKYIFSLNNDVVVFPGHGDDTSIGEERENY